MPEPEAYDEQTPGTGFERSPCAVLVAVCDDFQYRGAVDPEAIDRIARECDAPRDRVRAVARWVETAVHADPRDHVIRACRSVSCCSNGAVALHESLFPRLRSAGCKLDIEFVNCLAQCDIGPSIAVGRQIYVGARDDVVTDERPHRGGETR